MSAKAQTPQVTPAWPVRGPEDAWVDRLHSPALQAVPQPFPPAWASTWGEDRYGLWASFEVNGVVQACRWIPPGEFLMGSPEDEPLRSDAELQHRVRLTRGFWLADTACTQALWLAVMGENPSHFTLNADDLDPWRAQLARQQLENPGGPVWPGQPELPVENVSWDLIQQFLAVLNQGVLGLQAALPTEAQWEYACRAGTTTPFSFGAALTPELANYHGNHPYAGGVKGLDRNRTVPVKSFAPNAHGLYEMHGNVWEWCDDGLREFSALRAENPVGPRNESAVRALRGGCWIFYGRDLRSAYRSGYGPGIRLWYYGFRLAPGQSPS